MNEGGLKPAAPGFVACCKQLDHRSLAYRVFKRAFDVVFSICALAVGLVPGVLLAVAVSIDTKGTPIFAQTRVGKHGRPFKIYKLRTMVADSDDVEKYLTPEQQVTWMREHKVDDDPRVTRLGRIIRAVSLDEVVQFVNVLAGHMSVIGPRAITYDELEYFGSDQALLLSVAPGITGAWQCGPRNLATFENGVRQRVELDYAMHATLATDVKIFFKTFGVMFVKRTGK